MRSYENNARLPRFPSRRAAAIAFSLAGFLSAGRLNGQVEDLGSQAQGIVDQMRAQASVWTPQMQEQSAMGPGPGPSSSGGTTITFTPNTSAVNQRQLLQQEQRIQAFQQRQQLMMAGAQLAGQLAGQLLAQALFGSSADQQAEQARQQQARLVEEQKHQAQVQRAAQMRSDWDQRDAGMSEELGEVFSAPTSHSTPAFGISASVDPSKMDDLPLANNGTKFFGSGSSSGVSTSGSDSTAADDDSSVPPLAPEYLASTQSPTASSDWGLTWARLPEASPSTKLPDWTYAAESKLEGFVKSSAIDQAKSTAIYTQLTGALKYIPGYGLAIKAYGYGKDLKGQFDALEHPIAALNSRTISVFESGAAEAAETLSGLHSEGSGLATDYWNQVQDRGTDYQETGSKLAYVRAKLGVAAASKQDQAILIGSQ